MDPRPPGWAADPQCAGPRCHHIFRTLHQQSADHAKRHHEGMKRTMELGGIRGSSRTGSGTQLLFSFLQCGWHGFVPPNFPRTGIHHQLGLAHRGTSFAAHSGQWALDSPTSTQHIGSPWPRVTAKRPRGAQLVHRGNDGHG